MINLKYKQILPIINKINPGNRKCDLYVSILDYILETKPTIFNIFIHSLNLDGVIGHLYNKGDIKSTINQHYHDKSKI